jgi:hypothetical protein
MSRWVKVASVGALIVACGSNEPADQDHADGGTGASGGSASGSGGSSGSASGTGGWASGTGGNSGSASGGDSGSGTGTGGSSGSASGTGGASAAGGSGGSTTDGAAGASTGGTSSGSECADFPVFERACWDDAWCVTAFHQIDCCGTRIAMGIFHTAVPTFDAAEAACIATYGACFCPTQATTTDTGQTASDESVIAVQCRSGVCTTYVP